MDIGISLLDEDQFNQIVYEWNRTEAEYPADKTAAELFEEQAERTPERTAVVYENARLTYRELNGRANKLARYLTGKYGIGPDDLVALCLDRSEYMLIAILGILKAGGAYVPIAPDYPDERIGYILEDTGAKAALTNAIYRERLSSLFGDNRGWESIDTAAFWETLEGEAETNPPRKTGPRNLAYVIYTSGTTGQPKGTMLEHRGLVNRIHWMNSEYPLRETDKILQKTAYTFDVSVWELTWAIFYGAQIVFAKPEGHKDSVYLAELIEREQITVIHFVPSMLSAFEETVGFDERLRGSCESLRYIFCSGEALTLRQVKEGRRLFDRAEIHNLYGPTEASIDVLYYDCNNPDLQEVLIGKPIHNTTMYILDEGMKPAPIGAVGELYIGGVGVARGYLNKPELTAEKFIANPYQSEDEKARGYNEILYKTGDLARYLPDGNIEYLGRNDFQVKIRGFRIELGEIENKLLGYGGITQAVVVAKERGGEKYLAAYYTGSGELDEGELRAYMASALPEYMAPAAYVRLEELPLTANGKLDRRALPEPELGGGERYEGPADELERKLCGIYGEVLGIEAERVSAGEDFFRLGGNSIMAIKLVNRIRRELGAEVTVKEVFGLKSVRGIAGKIRRGAGSVAEKVREAGQLEGRAGITPIQGWFLEKAESGKLKAMGHYNQAFLIETPELDVELLEKSVAKLTEWHDAFRLRLRKGAGGEYEQYYEPAAGAVEVLRLDVRGKSEAEIERTLTEWQAGYDLTEGPVYSVGYLSGYEGGGGRIHIGMHHMIVDSVSWRIITEDLEALYGAIGGRTEELGAEELLGEKGTSYRQWAEAIAEYGKEISEDEQEYWDGIREGIGAYNRRLEAESGEGRRETTVVIGKEETEALLRRANATLHTEINDILLSGLLLALEERLEGAGKHYVTMEGHGREAIGEGIDLTRTVGWFTSLYPAMFESAGGEVRETVIGVKERLRGAPEKGIRYGGAYGYKDEELPGIRFNYLGQFDSESRGEGWRLLGGIGAGETVSRENADVAVLEINGGISGGQLGFRLTGRLRGLKEFGEAYQAALQGVIEELSGAERSYLTPSDTGWLVSRELLDREQAGVELEGIYEANSLQEGFIYHYLRQGGEDGAYIVQVAWEYGEGIEIGLLKEAWERAVKRYPALRLRFGWDEQLIQIVEKGGELDWRERDIGGQGEPEQEEYIKELLKEDRQEGYRLERGRLFRVYGVKRGAGRHTVVYSSHHAITDGWSNTALAEYIGEEYRRLEAGERREAEEDRVYIAAQEYLRAHRGEDEGYWERITRGGAGEEDLSGLMKAGKRGTELGEYRQVEESEEAWTEVGGVGYEKLKRLNGAEGITTNTVVQYGWHRMLKVYGNSSRTVVGMTVSGRELALEGIEESVGLYINTLPVVVEHRGGPALEALRELQEQINNANEHGKIAIGKLQKDGRRLFNSLCAYENYPEAKRGSGELLYTVEKLDYPLGVTAYERGGKLRIGIRYAGELFEREMIEGLLEGMKGVIEELGEDPGQDVGKLGMARGREYERIVTEWNRTEHEYPRDKTIVALFEEQAERTPENVAVVYEGKRLTYRELNEAANRVAHYLRREYGIVADDLVALCVERSEEMVIGILGALKAGGAYVPISPEYPEERIGYILEDTGAKAALVNEAHEGRVRKLWAAAEGRTLIANIDSASHRERMKGESNENPERVSGPDNLAYVIYTSGTTGRPKGVMIEHKGVVNLLTSLYKAYGFIPGKEVILHFANYIFDASVEQLFFPLLNGDILLLIRESLWQEKEFIEALKREQVTYIHMTPSFLQMIPVETLPTLRRVNSGGEALPMELHKRMVAGKHFSFVNSYGPTETTVTATVNLNGERNTIGRPIANTTCYILDSGMAPLPVGAVGELYIGGVGVARGYLNKPELTVEKFIANPYQSEDEKARGYNGILYRTGDLARYLPDGNIEYLGRNDFQVKIRGYRIELGEIESRVLEYEGIQQAVVVARERGGGKYLAAYYTGEGEIDEGGLREHIENTLPEYMAPAAYMRLDGLPVTVNGKLDRRALPEPEVEGGEGYEGPVGEVEGMLCGIYGEILGIDAGKVSVGGDFFRLGGNSIMAIKLANRIQKESGAGIRVGDIFKYRTVRKLAGVIGGEAGERIKIEPVKFGRVEEQVLSYAQGRLWFLENYERGSNAYNIPMVEELRREVDIESLKGAIKEVVRRHEVLRSVIKAGEGGEGYQEEIDWEEEPFEIVEVEVESDEGLGMEIGKEVNHIFRLDREYPIRVKVCRRGEERHISVVVHHIAFDGWSQEILSRELVKLYEYNKKGRKGPYPLEEMKLQYKDYAVWQRNYLNGEILEKQMQYWVDKLNGYETLNLMTDKIRPLYMRYEGDEIAFEFDKETSKRIIDAAKELEVTVYTVLLSAYYLLLSTYSNQTDIVLGTVTANRQYPEISDLIGFFVNTQALRYEIDREQDSDEFVKDVGKMVAEAQKYQDMPFDMLIDKLEASKDPSRSPIFQVMFTVQDTRQDRKAINSLFKEIQSIENKYTVAKFDISLTMEESWDSISGIFNYSVSLFERRTIESYIETYTEIVRQIIQRGETEA